MVRSINQVLLREPQAVSKRYGLLWQCVSALAGADTGDGEVANRFSLVDVRRASDREADTPAGSRMFVAFCITSALLQQHPAGYGNLFRWSARHRGARRDHDLVNLRAFGKARSSNRLALDRWCCQMISSSRMLGSSTTGIRFCWLMGSSSDDRHRVGMVNAVNEIDGLEGLAGGVSWWIGVVRGRSWILGCPMSCR